MNPDDSDPSPVTEERVTGLVGAPPPPGPSGDLGPDEIESYVRSAMHQDRRPGNVLAICHPLRMHKAPRDLLEQVRAAGFDVHVVETHPDRVTSVTRIRDALLAHSTDDVPLDVVVFSGDGSLDHHVVVAAFWAFYPDLVTYRDGAIDTSAVGPEDLLRVSPAYRRAFLDPLPDGAGIDPTLETLKQLWVLRSAVEPLLAKERSVSRILRKLDRHAEDAMLRVAVLSALVPEKVVLRAHGFDLSGLAKATRERTFQGLYPFIRAIAAYPAGTAADNAQYAGVPGWAYAQASRLFVRLPFLDGLRRWAERRTARRFMAYFTRNGVVVPARFSVIAFDGDWQLISSHAAGGPSAGRIFAADLSGGATGVAGYVLRLPQVILNEGLFGSTIVRLRAWTARGRSKAETEAQIAEGLYTNRTFIAGVGTVPATNPTSFAGQSSLVVVPPIWSRDDEGKVQISLRGVGTLAESILKGMLARVVHALGLNPGALAGGGRFRIAAPEHQITLKEGEELDIRYLTRDRRPRFVPTQVSGDPFQAWRTTIRVAWGPIPLLANQTSLLLGSARRSLRNLRIEQTYRLRSVSIGGLSWFRHQVGEAWSTDLTERTGLFEPPRTLPYRLARVQYLLLRRWQALGTGEFVDTSEHGLQMGRRGRHAHNNDQSAHLVLMRERRNTLLVRQVRKRGGGDDIHEALTTYRAFGPTYVIHSSQVRVWHRDEAPRIVLEEHYFRSAEEFRAEAPSFFPFIAQSPDQHVLQAFKTEDDDR